MSDLEIPTYSTAGHQAITAELNRLILGGRGPERPELLVGRAGFLRRMVLAAREFTSTMATFRSLGRAVAQASITATTFADRVKADAERAGFHLDDSQRAYIDRWFTERSGEHPEGGDEP
jgi:hypothetical protein